MSEGILIYAMKKKFLVPLMYLFPFSDFKLWTTETRSFLTNSTKSFLWSWKETQGHKFMHLAHFPCSLILHQFWFLFLVLSIQTISIWWMIWPSFCTTPLAKQSEPISWSLHEVLTQWYHTVFPGCWQWATPGTSQKGKNYESNNNKATRHS